VSSCLFGLSEDPSQVLRHHERIAGLRVTNQEFTT
jgi:hypothetical protein